MALAYADTVGALLSQLSCDASLVRAVGAHGQTVRHQPTGEAHERYTVQLLNGALLAERVGVDHLMRRLTALLPSVAVRTSAAFGLPPDQVEAAAFAWLARAFCAGRPGNQVAVTGAGGPRVLGALYPAGAPHR